MEDLIITPNKDEFDVPQVNFSAETGECFITGESYLENTFKFYDGLTNWVNDYFDSGKESLKLNFKLSYFNTSSSRAMLDLLKVLKSYQENGKNITVAWHYPTPDFDDMQQEGEDFAEDAGIKMEFIPYEDK